jgi:hypothetical protein
MPGFRDVICTWPIPGFRDVVCTQLGLGFRLVGCTRLLSGFRTPARHMVWVNKHYMQNYKYTRATRNVIYSENTV